MHENHRRVAPIRGPRRPLELANSVFTQALAERLRARGSAVKAVCAAPGLAATNLQVTTAADGGMAETWVMRFAQSAEDGTMPLLRCCLGAGVASGEFLEPGGMGYMKGPPAASGISAKEADAAAIAMLWKTSEKACGVWAL